MIKAEIDDKNCKIRLKGIVLYGLFMSLGKKIWSMSCFDI